MQQMAKEAFTTSGSHQAQIVLGLGAYIFRGPFINAITSFTVNVLNQGPGAAVPLH
jgi:hypothetical protein